MGPPFVCQNSWRSVRFFPVTIIGAVIKRTLVQPFGLAALFIQSDGKLLVGAIKEEE